MSGNHGQTERRAAAAHAGRCSHGCLRPAAPGRRKCQPCLDSDRVTAVERRLRLRSIATIGAWCDECQAFGFHRDRCAADRRSA